MKMNISMSMDFLKPIKNFFRKYTALLPSIAITVVALLIFIPTMLVGRTIKQEVNKSVGLARQVSSLMSDVPSREEPQLVKRYMDRLEEEANKIETLARESSMRELISYDVFPPKGTSSQLYVAFGKKYRSAVENMVGDMHALDAPSDAEISQVSGTRTTAAMDERGMPGRRGFGTTTTARDTNPMVEALCLKRAQEISVYANPSSFPWYDFWESYEFAGQQQAQIDCWDSQVTFWICQDIAQTISTMNQGSTKVSSSPVKRLMGVSFTGPVETGRSANTAYRTTTVTAVRERPNYITSSPSSGTVGATVGNTAAMQSNFVVASLTNRVSDADVDIVHFAFSVLVDNHYVMAFMKELCSEKQHTYRVGFKEDGEEKKAVHNQITILDTKINAIEKNAPEHELYRYGNGAVMRVDLVCEYQFDRKGYDVIKPEPVKEALGQAENQGQGQPTQTPGIDMMDRSRERSRRSLQ